MDRVFYVAELVHYDDNNNNVVFFFDSFIWLRNIKNSEFKI